MIAEGRPVRNRAPEHGTQSVPGGVPTQSMGTSFQVEEGADVTLKVFNVLGREVATLVRGYREAGRHQVAFDATDLGAGVYLYVIEAGSFTATRRMTLLK